MTAVLDTDPPSVTSLRRDASVAPDRVVRKCRDKNPEVRWQSARDLADELTWIQQAGPASSVAGGATTRSSTKTIVLVLLAALALAAAVVWADRARRREPSAPQFTRLTFQRGTISNARFSPDGRTIVYSASWEGRPSEVFMTATGSPESRALGARDADLMGISRAGELAMLRHGQVLAISPLTGTRSPRDIADRVVAADWVPDGAGLAAIRAWDPQRGLTPLEFPPGREVSTWKGSAQRIRVAPDGKSVVVSETPLVAEASRLTLISVSGEIRDLGRWSSITGFSFSPDGREIWLSGERGGSGPMLWSVTLAGDARELARYPGEPVLMDVAPDGRALITTVERRRHMTAVVDGRERDLSWLSASGVRGITTDGQTVVFEDISDAPGAVLSVWVRTVDGAPATRLGEGRPLDIAPEGQWVAATLAGPPAKLILYPTGAGTQRVLADGAMDYPAATFLPDGRRLLFVETPELGRSRLPFKFKLAELATGAVTAVGSDAGAIHVRHAVAPDGRCPARQALGRPFLRGSARHNSLEVGCPSADSWPWGARLRAPLDRARRVH